MEHLTKDYYKILTDKMIEKMSNNISYKKPWFTSTEFPYNPITGTVYKGINLLSLMSEEFSDPRFYTFNNIKKLSEESNTPILLKKGSKGFPVFKAVKYEINKNNETGEPNENQSNKNPFFIWRQVYSATVFNASQIDGIAPLETREPVPFSENNNIELLATAMKERDSLTIKHHSKGKSFYNFEEDVVMLPEKTLFKSDALYYRTLMHELGHATGGKNRLNRKLANTFGSPTYAQEELVAELCSYFLGFELGLQYDNITHDNHVGYLKSWIEILQNDKQFIFKAAGAANKAVDYLLTVKKEFEFNHNNQDTTNLFLKHTI